MANKYVDFVSDEEFLECVQHVCNAYPEDVEEINLEQLKRNVIDPVKQSFDIFAGKINYQDWLQNENLRQNDKTLNNAIGEFHQKLLGKVNGWIDLGVGDDTKLDLRKDDNTIFIELKNKYNTMNSDATDKCRDKLEKAIKEHPNAVAYWGFIISNNGSSGEVVWIKKGRTENPKIKKIWGKRIYSLVTGKENALEQVWKALPLAIKDLLQHSIDLSDEDEKNLKMFFDSAFH